MQHPKHINSNTKHQHQHRQQTRQNNKADNPNETKHQHTTLRNRKTNRTGGKMNDLDKHLKKILFQDCKNKVQNFNEICNYITQYSQANIFIIPEKYKETIENELKNLQHHTPILYEFRESEDIEDTITLTLFNIGVMQRENLLKETKK